VRVVYSPLDAVALAEKNPDKQVVFFAIGFETTAPPNVMSVLQAQRLGLTNYSILVSHVRVPPAIKAILSSPENRVQAFLLAGHVCAVMGYHEYPLLLEEFRIPMVVTGFEPLDSWNLESRSTVNLAGSKSQMPAGVTFEGLRPHRTPSSGLHGM
jgi:hydrogenase expression/formation protein HypD